jgi:hypothetical protein
MRSIILVVVVVVVTTLAALVVAQHADEIENPKTLVSETLDALHESASKADGQRYFALFAPDAVFLGTDATERWPIDEFKTYAMKRFETGAGWTYQVKDGQRFITISQDGSVAWFDELLENAKYGTCRGSGVLHRINGQWKIVQYNLSIPIPNDLAGEVVKMIRENSAVQP